MRREKCSKKAGREREEKEGCYALEGGGCGRERDRERERERERGEREKSERERERKREGGGAGGEEESERERRYLKSALILDLELLGNTSRLIRLMPQKNSKKIRRKNTLTLGNTYRLMPDAI